jgi:hypothetical protein
MIILFILLPLIFIVIGLSLLGGAVDSISKSIDDNKLITVQNKWNKHQKAWVKANPKGTREQYKAWFLEQLREGKI